MKALKKLTAIFLCVFVALMALSVCMAEAAPSGADFSPVTAMHYLKEAVEQRMPYGYYLKDEDYETEDEEFLKNDDDVYLRGTSTEQIRGGVAYCFDFSAFRLFAGRAIVFADGTVVFDFDDSYKDYTHLFPFLK